MEAIERLIHTVEWAKKLETNIEHITSLVGDEEVFMSRSFEEFFRSFQYTFLQHHCSYYPMTIYDFLEILKKPINEWGIFSESILMEEGISPDLVILDNEIGLTEEAEELLNEYKSYQELSSRIIEEVLIHCREKQKEDPALKMQEKYTAFRLFLIQHPLVNEEIVELFCIENKFDPFLTSALERCYEDVPLKYTYKCQACGWTLEEKTKNYFVCLKTECKKKFNASSLPEYKIIEQCTKRVKQSIQLTTVIPGIREMELVQRLKDKGAKVEIYPKLESLGDVKASKVVEDMYVELYIDVKDYKNPQRLARKLMEDDKKALIKTPIIAVPDEKATKKYLKFINQKLLDNAIHSCRVYSFKQVESLFERSNRLHMEIRKLVKQKEAGLDVKELLRLER